MRKYVLTLLFLALFPLVVFANNEPVVLEAEKAVLGSDFAQGTDGIVNYVYPKTNNSTFTPGTSDKVLTFSVKFPESGIYEMYARLRVGVGGFNDDSFFFGKDFGVLAASNTDSWAYANGLASVGYTSDNDFVGYQGSAGTQTWKWLNISEFYNNASPLTFTVTVPNATLTFQVGSREDGLDLDKIAFCRADYQYTVKNLNLMESGSNPSQYYNFQETYINPVLPGDHPDPSLLKVGDDFYACGSCFHFTPYSPIMHSKDLVHWEVISRVVPSTWSGLNSSAPAAGIWGGTLSYFYDSYWFYFSNTAGGGQYFCKASSPSGPWTTPVKVNTTVETGSIGYDNSIFVDDDGTPYMMIKPGQFVNRIQKIGTNGHLTGSIINLDWINTGKKYSWAEGPVMCKRNGWYYYFVAGNVSGGQYVLRSKTLTSDSLSWQAMGNFFESVSDANVMFRSPNHISQPFMLADSTWWTISHSYENLSSDSWDGKGRQGLLHQIVWDANGKPTGKAPTTSPIIKPASATTSIPWRLPRSDQFDSDVLKLCWHFLNPSNATKFSLKLRPGWLTLTPGTDSCHILQKDAGHNYTLITRVLARASTNGQAAGLYLTNGNMTKSVKLTTGYNDGKKLTFSLLTTSYEVPNEIGDTIWFRLERMEHLLTASYGADGKNWTPLGSPINALALDQSQDGYNSWVGNSQGLFANEISASFDQYGYRDGFSALPLASRENQYGVETVTKTIGKVVSNTSSLGGWLMLGGVDMGNSVRKSNQIAVYASSILGGTLEVWMDDMERAGTKLADVVITSTGSTDTWKNFTADMPETIGQHDLFFRFKGPKNAFYLNTVRLISDMTLGVAPVLEKLEPFNVYPNPTSDAFRIEKRRDAQEATYEILDLSGHVLETGRFYGTSTVGTRLQTGAYLLRMISDNQNQTCKIFKK
jgi:xylan 1,4-beta-xylosidase